MKNYEAEKLKKIIAQKELAMMKQVEETDRLRNENLSLKAELTQCYRIGYNKAIDDAAENAVAIEDEEISYPYPSYPGMYHKKKVIIVDKKSILKLKK